MRVALVLLFAPLIVKATDDMQGDDFDASDDRFAEAGGESVCTRDTEIMEGVAPGERHAVTLGEVTDCTKAHAGWPHHLGGWWNAHYSGRSVTNNVYGTTMGKTHNTFIYSLAACKSKAEEHSSKGERVIAYSFSSGHNRCDVWTGDKTYNLVSHGVLGTSPYGWADWCCSYWRTYKFCGAPVTAPPTIAPTTLPCEEPSFANMDLMNSATRVSAQEVQLTAEANNQKGGVFAKNTIDPSNFHIEFDILVGSRDTDGADGLTFTVADTAKWSPKVLGDGGTCMGSCAYTQTATKKSIPGFVVEFDTWYSGARKGHKPQTGAYWDTTSKDHVAAFLNGVGGPRIGTQGDVEIGPNGNLENGQWHSVSLRSCSGQFIVMVNGKTRIQADYKPDFAAGTYGWTAATGGARNTHRVRNPRLCTCNSAPEVSGDPFVTDHTGAKKQFFLPLQTDVLLLACQGMSIHGRAFGTGIKDDHQQWFDKFNVAINGEEQLVVSVMKNATAADHVVADAAGNKQLQLLNIQVEKDTMTKTGAMGLDNGALIAVWSSPTGEIAQFSHGSTVFQIKSAVAQKFTEKAMQTSYTHLDLRFVELKTSACSGGVLAEIWGAVPMTQTTSKMLQPPQ